MSRSSSGIEISSEIENFKRAAHQTPIFFCGEFCRSISKISSEIELFNRDCIFTIFGPLVIGQLKSSPELIKGEKKQRLNFLWPKMARLGPPPSDPQIPPKKCYAGPIFAMFPRKWGTYTFCWGAKMHRFGWGTKIANVEHVYVLFPSLSWLSCDWFQGKKNT